MDFNDATTNQIRFTRVRIRFGITDCLRFFRRACFESRERAMLSFQYERLRRLCSHCFRLTHQRSHCPYNQMPPTPRNSPEVLDVPVFNRRRVYDEERRSDINSQSQNSENSFPAPLSPPPRVAAPPLNSDELAAASPYFPGLSLEELQRIACPIPQAASWRRQSSTGSNISINNEEDISSGRPRNFEVGESSRRPNPRNFEVGESSRRPNSHFNNRGADRNQKQKLQEQ
ncbi:Zinc knuckle CX2CX4HX4C [Arabidopsis suecica]|uniref:Zinc knuckle CX2CX4HX4C n=1 Tax=Arabidopsis suecica TaxID=45249 RepID=A0A8T1ZY24_ARASU|nr:Zinc knuckle CX2CX4HX4C [Arabidopsis suecica]